MVIVEEVDSGYIIAELSLRYSCPQVGATVIYGELDYIVTEVTYFVKDIYEKAASQMVYEINVKVERRDKTN